MPRDLLEKVLKQTAEEMGFYVGQAKVWPKWKPGDKFRAYAKTADGEPGREFRGGKFGVLTYTGKNNNQLLAKYVDDGEVLEIGLDWALWVFVRA